MPLRNLIPVPESINGVEPYSAVTRRRRPRRLPIIERVWDLFEWTWKLVLAAFVGAFIGLASAQDPSLDDGVRGAGSGLSGLGIAKLISRKQKGEEDDDS